MGTPGLTLFFLSEQRQQRLGSIRFSLGCHEVPNSRAVPGHPGTQSYSCEQGAQGRARHHSPSQIKQYLMASWIIST